MYINLFNYKIYFSLISLLKGGDKMEIGLTSATWAWLLIPMPMIILFSIITYITEKGADE